MAISTGPFSMMTATIRTIALIAKIRKFVMLDVMICNDSKLHERMVDTVEKLMFLLVMNDVVYVVL